MANALLSVSYLSTLVREAAIEAGHETASCDVQEDPISRNLEIKLTDANGNHFTFNVGIKKREMVTYKFLEWLIAAHPLAFTPVPK
jgi:hypothetical protein